MLGLHSRSLSPQIRKSGTAAIFQLLLRFKMGGRPQFSSIDSSRHRGLQLIVSDCDNTVSKLTGYTQI
jgi:hypothetical protein